MKKILIFSTAYLPFVGGAELAVKEITDRLNDFSWDMITLRFDKNWPVFEKINNINVYRINCSKMLFPFCAFFKALKLNKKNHYDLIWSIMANRAGFAALFFKLFHPKTKFLLTLQEGDVLDYPKQRMGVFWLFLRPLFVRIFTKADYIQAISKYLADWARQMGVKCPIEVVPNGVDINKFSAQGGPASGREARNEKILVTSSRLVKKNAVGDIIEALRFLPENIKFWILGDGPEQKNYSLLVTRYSLQDRVVFFGQIEQSKMAELFGRADIFIRPSLSEGLGNSFLEAMAAGIPVIGTRVGGIPDFLIPPTPFIKEEKQEDTSPDKGRLGGVDIGPTGLFCEVNNPKSIAEKVKLLLENGDLRNKIIANAQKLVRENYDWNLIAGKMRVIFNKL